MRSVFTSTDSAIIELRQDISDEALATALLASCYLANEGYVISFKKQTVDEEQVVAKEGETAFWIGGGNIRQEMWNDAILYARLKIAELRQNQTPITPDVVKRTAPLIAEGILGGLLEDITTLLRRNESVDSAIIPPIIPDGPIERSQTDSSSSDE